MQLNMPEPDRCPPHSDLIGRKYCGLFKRYKMQKCYVLLCPLHTLKDKSSNDRKKETDQELINRFDIRQCFVLIKKAPIKFTDQRLLLKVLEKPKKSFDKKLVIRYSFEFFQQSVFNIFLENKGKQSVDFTEFFKRLNSRYWNLDYDSFIRHLYSLYEEFRLKNQDAPKNISIVIDVDDSYKIREQQETLKRATSPHTWSELCKKTTKDFLDMEMRYENLDYSKTGLPGKIAESQRKKVVKVFSQVGQTVEMLQKETLQRRMKMNQYLLEIRNEEVAQNIRSRSQLLKLKCKVRPLKIKGWATALKIKNRALALTRKDKILALKRKDKTLALKRRNSATQSSPEEIETHFPLERKHGAGILQMQTSQKSLDKKIKIKLKEPALKNFQELSEENVITGQLLPEVKEPSVVISILPSQETVAVDNPSTEIIGKEPDMGYVLDESSEENTITDPFLFEVKERDQEVFLSQDLLDVKSNDPLSEIMVRDLTLQKEPFQETEVIDNTLLENEECKLNTEILQWKLNMEILQEEPSEENAIRNPFLTEVIPMGNLSEVNVESLQFLNDTMNKDTTGKPWLDVSFLGNEAANKSLLERKVGESAIDILQEHVFDTNILTNPLSPVLGPKELPLEMIQKQLLRDGIEADQPVTSGLEIPLLEKVNADQDFSEITEDPPVLELMEKQG